MSHLTNICNMQQHAACNIYIHPDSYMYMKGSTCNTYIHPPSYMSHDTPSTCNIYIHPPSYMWHDTPSFIYVTWHMHRGDMTHSCQQMYACMCQHVCDITHTPSYICICIHTPSYMCMCDITVTWLTGAVSFAQGPCHLQRPSRRAMGWLRLVGSLKW